jgi:Mg-chelatase subunit ChlD
MGLINVNIMPLGRVFRIVGLWLLIIAFLSSTVVSVGFCVKAQGPPNHDQRSPSLPGAASEVQEAGFSLKTAGAIGFEDWDTQNPKIIFNFSIDRADRTPFDGLTFDHIRALSSGYAISIGSADLERKTAASSSVIVFIDRSGSMIPPSGSVESAQRIDKLSAAKTAIGDFLDNLQPSDRVAIFAFDQSQSAIFDISDNKESAKLAVNEIQVAFPGANYTALYDSLEYAIQTARQLNARNIVFLTDGMEDTPEFGILTPTEQEDYRGRKEQQVALLAKQNGVRIYTIGIGDRNSAPGSPTYVDFDTLNAIATATNGGAGHYVDLPSLQEQALNDPEQYHASLVAELTDILADINKSFHYDYSLVLRPQPSMLVHDGTAQTIRVECAVGSVRLPVEILYTWPSESANPHFGPPNILPSFIPPVTPGMNDMMLTSVYLSFLVGLLLLTTMPAVFQKFEARRRLSVAENCIVIIRGDSPFIGKECPNERNRLGRDFLIRKGDAVVVCPNCHTPHHVGCWHLTKDTCWVRTCQNYVALSPETLRAHDVEV